MPTPDKPLVEISDAVGEAAGDFIGGLADVVRDALELEGLPSEDAYQAIRAASTRDEAVRVAQNYVTLKVIEC